MTSIKYILIFITVIITPSCIESYFINDEVGFEPVLVVDALITDEREEQKIVISETTSLIDYTIHLVHNCQVVVSDKDGNDFTFTENPDQGYYQGIIPFEFLVPGNAFKITIETDRGRLYTSDFEELTACAPIDSVYYDLNVEMNSTSNTLKSAGLQFYVDLKTDKNHSQFYRWALNETYEFHSAWPIEQYWAGFIRTQQPDYSYFTCYKSEPVLKLFAASTKNVVDQYLKYPLAFVDNSTQRLYWRYSLLVKQLSITENAYNYWKLLMANSQESGGLDDSQPANIKGNIYCVSHPEEKVLGYFSVSSVTEKRIFIGDEMKPFHSDDVFCKQYTRQFPMKFLEGLKRSQWPYYLAPVLDGEAPDIYFAEQDCFDCRMKGGSLEVPDIWKD